MVKIDRRKLIAEAEKLVHDKQLGFAASIEVPIQDVKLWDIDYELKLVISVKGDNNTANK